MRVVTLDKLFPFLFTPIGNGKPVDGQKRRYEFGSTFAFRFIAASGEDFVAPSGGDNKGLVATGEHSAVNVDVPLSQRCADGLDFAFDGGFDGREDHPTLVGGEGAGRSVLTEKVHSHSSMCTFASSKSERSLAIQNNVPQCTPLISKSLPNHPPLNGNTLLSNKIFANENIESAIVVKLRNYLPSPLQADAEDDALEIILN